MSQSFSHFDEAGQAHMVNVGDKPDTHRVARARGRIVMARTTAEAIQSGRAEKGDVLGIARIAAIQATKKTADLIPLCHPLPLTHVSVQFAWCDADPSEQVLEIEVRTETRGKTGVEMEALTAVNIGLLTVYDMCKAIDRGMRMTDIGLIEKSGGQSGHWTVSA